MGLLQAGFNKRDYFKADDFKDEIKKLIQAQLEATSSSDLRSTSGRSYKNKLSRRIKSSKK
jgi:hypothetical protein